MRVIARSPRRPLRRIIDSRIGPHQHERAAPCTRWTTCGGEHCPTSKRVAAERCLGRVCTVCRKRPLDLSAHRIRQHIESIALGPAAGHGAAAARCTAAGCCIAAGHGALKRRAHARPHGALEQVDRNRAAGPLPRELGDDRVPVWWLAQEPMDKHEPIRARPAHWRACPASAAHTSAVHASWMER